MNNSGLSAPSHQNAIDRHEKAGFQAFFPFSAGGGGGGTPKIFAPTGDFVAGTDPRNEVPPSGRTQMASAPRLFRGDMSRLTVQAATPCLRYCRFPRVSLITVDVDT